MFASLISELLANTAKTTLPTPVGLLATWLLKCYAAKITHFLSTTSPWELSLMSSCFEKGHIMVEIEDRSEMKSSEGKSKSRNMKFLKTGLWKQLTLSIASSKENLQADLDIHLLMR